jgi:nucleotide-binding universal stress UspA family protein
MFKRILVPLDGSRVSSRALPYALEIAQHFDAEIILMQVISPTTPFITVEPETGIGGSSITTKLAIEDARREDRKNIVRSQRYLRGKLKSVTARDIKGSYHIAMGMPAKSILDYCKEKDVDLVVMTTSGKSGIKRAIMGSVADVIIRDPTFPVLVIRPKDRQKKHKK